MSILLYQACQGCFYATCYRVSKLFWAIGFLLILANILYRGTTLVGITNNANVQLLPLNLTHTFNNNQTLTSAQKVAAHLIPSSHSRINTSGSGQTTVAKGTSETHNVPRNETVLKEIREKPVVPINKTKERTLIPRVFVKDASCAALFRNDTIEMERAKRLKRFPPSDASFMKSTENCQDFLQQREYTLHPVTVEEAGFPIAYRWVRSLQWRHNEHDGFSNHQPQFTQPFIQAEMKENIKAPRHWSLCGEFTGERWIPRAKSQ